MKGSKKIDKIENICILKIVVENTIFQQQH